MTDEIVFSSLTAIAPREIGIEQIAGVQDDVQHDREIDDDQQNNAFLL